jgi:glycosyltransferase involved in cell wall biosynthesis
MPDAYRLIRTAMAIRVRFAIRELTVVSSYLADRWRKEMLYRRPIAVIANIVPALPPPANPSSVRNRWVVLDVATDSRLKNVRTLIHAFATVLKKYPQAELRLVGPGLGAVDAIADWARSCRLDANVTFVGSLDRARIADEYARASIFCHPSLEEAQPLALLEALDAGLVVIGGESSGGVPWTLFGGRAGILVDVTSASAIADGISDAMALVDRGYCLDPDLAQAIEARHGRDAVTRAYVSVYRRLISEAKVSRIKSAERCPSRDPSA